MHNHCPTCREAGKGDDKIIKCFIFASQMIKVIFCGVSTRTQASSSEFLQVSTETKQCASWRSESPGSWAEVSLLENATACSPDPRYHFTMENWKISLRSLPRTNGGHLNSPCWLRSINWLPQLPNEARIPLPCRDINPLRILNQAQARLPDQVHQGLGINKFQTRRN